MAQKPKAPPAAHTIEIIYCTVWNYYPRAAGLADSIKKEVGIEPKLTKGKDGIFDVLLDGKLVFSKHEVGRFPEEDEVLVPLAEKVKKKW